MATNPNRPQYQDTIESTWGQSVADHVIRRYASAAERDADLAALTPADLDGQVCVITGSNGVPYMQEHRQGQWHGEVVRFGVSTVTVGGAANFSVVYEEMPGTPQFRLALVGPGMPAGMVCSPTWNAVPGNCEFQVWNADGSASAQGSILNICWIVGWSPAVGGATTRPRLEGEPEGYLEGESEAE